MATTSQAWSIVTICRIQKMKRRSIQTYSQYKRRKTAKRYETVNSIQDKTQKKSFFLELKLMIILFGVRKNG